MLKILERFFEDVSTFLQGQEHEDDGFGLDTPIESVEQVCVPASS